MALDFFFYSFTKEIWGSFREVGIFGIGLQIQAQFLQNFSSANWAEMFTGVTYKNSKAG